MTNDPDGEFHRLPGRCSRCIRRAVIDLGGSIGALCGNCLNELVRVDPEMRALVDEAISRLLRS